MEIQKLTGSKLAAASRIVPLYILGEAEAVIGCEVDQHLAGAAALMKKDEEWVLTWLYVEPEHREKGYGNALLDEAIKIARKGGCVILTATLDQNGEKAALVTAMLGRRGFILAWDSIVNINVNKDQFQKAVFLTDDKYAGATRDKNLRVLPLQKVQSIDLMNFVKKQERSGNYLVSRANYELADVNLSKVLICDDQVEGVMLIESEEEGKYSIDLCYVSKKHQLGFVGLCKALAKELLAPENHFEKLSFACMEDSVKRLGEHIFPEHDVEYNDIVSGQLLFF